MNGLVTDLETAVATMTGEVSDIEQRAGVLLQSCRLLLERVSALGELTTSEPCALVWHKDFPQRV